MPSSLSHPQALRRAFSRLHLEDHTRSCSTSTNTSSSYFYMHIAATFGYRLSPADLLPLSISATGILSILDNDIRGVLRLSFKVSLHDIFRALRVALLGIDCCAAVVRR